MTRVAFARALCGVAACSMAAALILGAKTAANVSIFPPPIDKLAHFAYFGIMAALLAHALGIGWLWVPLVLVPLVGAVDEWQQMSVAGRDSSLADWIADLIGVTVFVYGYWKWVARKRASK